MSKEEHNPPHFIANLGLVDPARLHGKIIICEENRGPL
jgi:hypothetical protein